MRLSLSLACLAVLFGVSNQAKADLFTVNYTGHIPDYQIIDPYRNTAISYSGSSFTLTAVTDLDNLHYPGAAGLAPWGITFVQFTATGFSVSYHETPRENLPACHCRKLNPASK
jgi:hypothetical protein